MGFEYGNEPRNQEEKKEERRLFPSVTLFIIKLNLFSNQENALNLERINQRDKEWRELEEAWITQFFTSKLYDLNAF